MIVSGSWIARQVNPRDNGYTQLMQQFTQILIAWGLPIFVIVLLASAVAWALLRVRHNDEEHNLPRQIGFVVLGLLLPVALILSLPFDIETRGQLLSLYGLVITAVIALASTSTVSNIMAGLTLRGMNNFHLGDFIHVHEYFGRVTERGLLHTEIQSEDRDLITLPNTFLAQNPVKVVRSSGTLISANLSIGYDVHRVAVTEALQRAAESAGLEDGFVQITELGNFAVHYRVSGFLKDITNLVSKRTELRARTLDALHNAGIEIMSPTVMAQRPLPADALLVPPEHQGPEPETGRVETLMFDKAEVAARIIQFEADKARLLAEVVELQGDAEANAHRIRWRERQIDALEQMLATLNTGHETD